MAFIGEVAVTGLGYIGLPTAAILASKGLSVTGIDISDAHVDAVNRGEVPFVEPDLAQFVSESVKAGRLRAQKHTTPADVHIVAVPTPVRDGQPDLSYIDAATDAIAPTLKGGELVILESTSPPGTTEGMARRILAARPDLSLDGEGGRPIVDFAHCPERVLPGRVMIELVENDRIIGGLTPQAAERARDLYAVFCEAELHLTDATTAEMAKLTENSFRDVNIAFANELSMIADAMGIDVFELIELANKHPRVNILQPGPGVGGHCIAVDPWFIVAAQPERARLIRTAREVNDSKPDYVLDKVYEAIEGREQATVACLGLAFKPNIDDLRESPSLRILQRLAAARPDITVLAVEPHIEQLPASVADVANVSLVSVDDAIAKADVLVLLVDHDQFKAIDVAQLGDTQLVDTRGVWR